MERVAFLVESTGQRLDCLLNPESVTVRREAGIQQRRVSGGPITGFNVSDSPLIHVGGGSTEIDLDLLFDVSLVSGESTIVDVRELTKPLWDLAENEASSKITSAMPFVWFVWGKFWRIFGVISSVAERLEHFTTEGIPRRSWFRLKMLRVPEPMIDELNQQDDLSMPLSLELDEFDSSPFAETDELQGEVLIDIGDEALGTPQRIDLAAYILTGYADFWRKVISPDIDNPLDIAVNEENKTSSEQKPGKD